MSNDENTSIIDKLPNNNDGGEICQNLTFLGRFGLKNVNGISVAYLSGIYDSNLFSKTPSEIRTSLAIKELKHNKQKQQSEKEEKEDNNDNDKDEETEQKLEDTKAATEFRRFYCSKDVKQMNLSKNVDILLTSEWGRLFHLGIVHQVDKSSIIPNNLSLSQFSKLGRSPIVNKLALQFNPQYHFTGNEDIFFRLCPYKTNDTTKYLTRFISLGKVSSSSKQRSIYACNITPISSQSSPQTIPSSIIYTKCPYTLPFKSIPGENGEKDKDDNNTNKDELKRVVHKRTFSEMMNQGGNNGNSNNSMHHRWSHPHRKNSDNPPSNYVCYKCGIPGHYINECQQFKKNKTTTNQPGGNRDDYFFEKFGGRRAMKRARKSGGECWFCLGSTKVESHMVLSIAEYTYLALAKGPMIKDHLLIIPINHLSNSMKFPVGVRKEIDRYLICLEKCYEKENKILLICDRNLPTQYTQHCYLEIVAIDKDKIDGLKEVLFKEAEKHDIKFDVKTKKDNNYNVGSFGYLILHNNGNGEKYIHSLQSGIQKRIPLNFLRKVIAIHLEIPEKSEWTACIQQTAEETNQTNRLKDKFKSYDWTQSQLLNK